MIIDMLNDIMYKLTRKFTFSVLGAKDVIQEAITKEGKKKSEELEFIIKKASSDEKNERLRTASIYALYIWYKFYRIGKFYIPEYNICNEIKVISVSKEKENIIRQILKSGKTSDSENIRYWSKLAFDNEGLR